MDIKIIPTSLVGASRVQDFSTEPKFSLDYSSSDSLLVEGAALLAQMVIKQLFTRRGSVLSSPQEGTLLPSIAGTGNNVSTEISSTILEDAIYSVERSIKRMQGPGSSYKPSEVLDSITVQKLTTSESGLEATITIVNSLGETALISVGV